MKCPGQDTQYWKPGAIFEVPCPQCGKPVEFFKDDTQRKCNHCGHRFVNPQLDFGCAAYCKFASQCLGNLPPELLAQKEDLFKDRVAIEVKRALKTDFKAIGRAVRRARHAEQIGKGLQANMAVVLMAAYLMELDSPGSSDKAREILKALAAPEPMVDQVCRILEAMGRAEDTGLEGQVVSEADLIVKWEDSLKEGKLDGKSLEKLIGEKLKSDAARQQARSLLHN